MIELVAITDDPGHPEPPLRAVECDGLAVLCTPVEGATEVDAELLWSREELMERLMERRDLLPVRFGTLVADERAAADALRARHTELAAALDRVRGAVELSVRVVSTAPEERADTAPATGRDFLRGKLSRLRSARLIHEALEPLARDSVVRAGPDTLRAAYLVDRTAVDAFVSEVRSIQRRCEGVEVLCTGPWAPYSFSEATTG